MAKVRNAAPIVAFVFLWIGANLLLGILMMNSYSSKVSDASFAGMYLIFGPIFYGLPLAVSCALISVGVWRVQQKRAHSNTFLTAGAVATVAIYVYFLSGV